MQFADWQSIGKILRPHGYKGECLLKFEITGWQQLKKLESVMLLLNNQPVPFFIKHLSVRSDGKGVVKFENITSEDEAKKLTSAELFADKSVIKKLLTNVFDPETLLGYTVIDEKHGSIGTIEEILKSPAHAILQIKKGHIEILIPAINKQIIKRTDHQTKTVTISAPEGLIEMYL